jgi:hypothetical protein
MITLHFGGHVPRKRQLQGPDDQELIRSFQGEFCLFVKGCAWRIQDNEKIIGGWAEPEQCIQTETARLVGSIVTQVRCVDESWDLLIEFSGRFVLQLFCDRTLVGEIDNYSLRTPDGWFTVGARSELTHSQTKVRFSKNTRAKTVADALVNDPGLEQV